MTRISDLQGTNLFKLFLISQIPYLYYAQEYILYLAMTSLSPGLWKIESDYVDESSWSVTQVGLDNNRNLSYLEIANSSLTKEVYLIRDYDRQGNLSSIQFISIDPNRDFDSGPSRIDIDIDSREIRCIPRKPEMYSIRHYSVDEHLRISSDRDKYFRLSKSISVIENMWGAKSEYSTDTYETSSFRITVSREGDDILLVTTDTSSVVRVIEKIHVKFRKETV